MVLYYLPEENMETILDTKSLKIYSEIIDKYTIYYTLERTSYPYYVLTKMEVYKDNTLMLKVNTNLNIIVVLT